MDRWAGKTAVVTGAASGIGKAIAVTLLKNKVNVLALDKNYEKLSAIDWHGPELTGNCCFKYCDVTKESDLISAFATAEREWNGGVDIMINNAGITDYRRVIDSERTTFEKLLNTNVLAGAVCITKAVHSMRKRQVEGHIFNINSVLGHEIPSESLRLSEIDGYNGWNLYPASKHAAVALTHTVRQELAAIKAPIRITSICPGLVDTGITNGETPIMEIVSGMLSLQPEDVADAVIYALGTRPEVQEIRQLVSLRNMDSETSLCLVRADSSSQNGS